MKRYLILVCAMLLMATYTTYAGPPISGGGGGAGDVSTDTIWDAAGDLVQGTGANAAAKLTAGTAGAYLRSAGPAAANVWSTLLLPNSGTAYYLPVFTAANTMGQLAASGTTGQVLTAVTGAIPAWTSGFNGTVGATTPAAGTFTSVDVVRQASDSVSLTKAQSSTFYEDMDDGDHYRIFNMPNLTTTHVQLEPVGDPTVGQVKAYSVPVDPGGGLPFVSTGTWVTPALARTEKLATFSFSGGGSAIPAATKVDSYIPAASTITGWVMLSTTSCSMVVDIWSQAYADFPPEVGQTIIQSEKPTLSAAAMGQDLSLAATWTEALAANVTLRANVDSSDCTGNVSVTLIGTIP